MPSGDDAIYQRRLVGLKLESTIVDLLRIGAVSCEDATEDGCCPEDSGDSGSGSGESGESGDSGGSTPEEISGGISCETAIAGEPLELGKLYSSTYNYPSAYGSWFYCGMFAIGSYLRIKTKGLNAPTGTVPRCNFYYGCGPYFEIFTDDNNHYEYDAETDEGCFHIHVRNPPSNFDDPILITLRIVRGYVGEEPPNVTVEFKLENIACEE